MREVAKSRVSGFGLAALALAAWFVAMPAQADRHDRMDRSTSVQVLTGGVGEGERAKLEEQARGYNLKLVFTLGTGNYLAEVPFQITRGGKVVVDEVSKGPWAFVNLPPGNYTVKATYEGKTHSRNVSVGKGGRKNVSLAWQAPARVAEQPPTR